MWTRGCSKAPHWPSPRRSGTLPLIQMQRLAPASSLQLTTSARMSFSRSNQVTSVSRVPLGPASPPASPLSPQGIILPAGNHPLSGAHLHTGCHFLPKTSAGSVCRTECHLPTKINHRWSVWPREASVGSRALGGSKSLLRPTDQEVRLRGSQGLPSRPRLRTAIPVFLLSLF